MDDYQPAPGDRVIAVVGRRLGRVTRVTDGMVTVLMDGEDSPHTMSIDSFGCNYRPWTEMVGNLLPIPALPPAGIASERGLWRGGGGATLTSDEASFVAILAAEAYRKNLAKAFDPDNSPAAAQLFRDHALRLADILHATRQGIDRSEADTLCLVPGRLRVTWSHRPDRTLPGGWLECCHWHRDAWIVVEYPDANSDAEAAAVAQRFQDDWAPLLQSTGTEG